MRGRPDNKTTKEKDKEHYCLLVGTNTKDYINKVAASHKGNSHINSSINMINCTSNWNKQQHL